MIAPKGPVAMANVRGSEKIPAPIMLPSAGPWRRDCFECVEREPHSKATRQPLDLGPRDQCRCCFRPA